MKIFKTTVLLLFGMYCVTDLHSQMPTFVEVDLVQEEVIEQSIPIIGSILPKKESNLMSSVAGRINKVLIQEGDEVKKNQILAYIDIKNYEWLYEISLSNLEKAELIYETTKIETLINDLDYKRMQSLKNSSAFNVSKFDKLKNIKSILESKEKIALSELNIEKNKKKIANLNYQKSIVRAPFSGVIEKRMVDIGEVVSIGTPMFNLVNKEQLEVFAEIPSFRTYGLNKGDIIKVISSDKIALDATIRAIGAKENPTTRTTKIYLNFSNNEVSRNFLVGENINLFIPVGLGKKAITVHKDAILKREGMSFVYITKKNIVEVKPLKLGEAVGNRFIVLNGLLKNNEVVIKGNERLRPGQEVKVIRKKN